MLKSLPEFAAKLRRAKTKSEAFGYFSEAVSRVNGVRVEVHQLPSGLPGYAEVRVVSAADAVRLVSPFATITGPKNLLQEQERWWLSILSDWTLDVLTSFESRTRHGLTCLCLDAELQPAVEKILRNSSVVGLLAIRFEGVESNFLELLDVVRLRFPGSRMLSAGSGADGVSVLWPNYGRELLIQSVGSLREDLETGFLSLGLSAAKVSMGLSHYPGDSKGVTDLLAGAQVGAQRAAELPGNCIHAVVAPGEGPDDAGGGVGAKLSAPPKSPPTGAKKS